MVRWFERRSIRSRIGLLILVILLPVSATLAWFLASDVQRAKAAARERVHQLATRTSSVLQYLLSDTGRVMSHLAARPAVQAMGPSACDSMLDEVMLLTPGCTALSVHDLQGHRICGHPVSATTQEMATWLPAAQQSGGLQVGPVQRRAATGMHTVALSQPIRSASGQLLGQLVLDLDLLSLSQHLLPPMPGHAVVTVVDANRTVLMRSADPAIHIGSRPPPAEIDPARGAQQGYFEINGFDNVPRLFAFVTVPQTGWRVGGSLPVADVLAPYHDTRQRILAIGLGLALLALLLAWRLSAAIVRPVDELRAAAERVTAGHDSVRSPLGGPPELQAVALAFNRMLDARMQSESRLRGIFSSALDAIITCDEDQRIVDANPAAASMFRCSADDMLGAPLERFIPVRFRQAHAQAVRQFGEQGADARRMAALREVLALRADGEEFPIEASISQLSLGGRRLYTVIHRDVTERRRTELALRESEARTRQLLAQLPEAVLVSRGDRIGFVNQAACQLFGAEAVALLGRPLADFAQAGSHPQLLAHLAHGTQPAPEAEITIVRGDGVLRQVQAQCTPVAYNGDQATLVVLRDITELKCAQADLEASHADLTRLVVELDNIQEEERKRIARELHDDLQQTLAAIHMDIGAIRAAPAGTTAAALQSLGRVEQLADAAIASTRRMINDMRPQVLEDLGLVPALEALAARFAQRHGVACSLQADGLPQDDARIDPKICTCLYRVAQEALNNVAKHAQAGQVQMALQQVAPDRLRLRIRDDGLGFADDALRKPQSFGLLGMRERVRAVQGTLWIDGAAGTGTTLEVEVPMTAA